MSHKSDFDLFTAFRDPKIIQNLKEQIEQEASKLSKELHIMEVCGGHTHTIMKYGLNQLLPPNISFIHGPGCPVCVMPKERVDQAQALAEHENVILVTLGDMLKVPGSKGSLQLSRSKGADVRFVYSPMDTIKIALENRDKKVIFFAIGFETTTPMTAALIRHVIEQDIPNLLFHINHITVPEPMQVLLDDPASKIDAFIGPAHVSVISGAKIYEPFVTDYHRPVVVSGFEPVDVMASLLMILKQVSGNRCELQIQYSRSVDYDGNLTAQKLIDTYMQKREHFRWRGLGDIPHSALQLRAEFAHLDAEKIYADILPTQTIDDHKLCICGSILKGQAKPHECRVFGTACTPSTPLGSCMVSSEGACAAYFKFGQHL